MRVIVPPTSILSERNDDGRGLEVGLYLISFHSAFYGSSPLSHYKMLDSSRTSTNGYDAFLFGFFSGLKIEQGTRDSNESRNRLFIYTTDAHKTIGLQDNILQYVFALSEGHLRRAEAH